MKTAFLDCVNPDVLDSYVLAVREMIAALDSGDAARIAAARITRDVTRDAMQREHDAYLAAE